MVHSSVMMDWVQIPALRLMVALSETPSIGAAARRIGMAQPNASRTIALMERRIGVRIIERSPRGSTLTQHGRLVVSWAQEALDSVERFILATQALADSGTAKVSVGASQTVAEYLAPLWISRLRRTHPHVTVVLHMHNSEQVVDGVTGGKFDIGFIEAPDAPHHLNLADILEDQLAIVVSPDHEWAELASRGGSVAKKDLATTPLVVRELGSGTRALIDEALSHHDRAQPVSELNSTSAIIRAARQGIGPAVLSRLAADEEVKSGRLVSVSVNSGPLARTLRAIWAGPARLTGLPAHMLDTALRVKGADITGPNLQTEQLRG